MERMEPGGQLTEEWEELAEHASASPFVRPGWFEAWSEAFGGGPILVLTVRDGSQLAGVMPLIRHRGALLAPVNWHTPAFAPVAADAEALEELARRLMAEPAPWIDASFLDRDGPEVVALRTEAERAGRRVVQRAVARQPFVDTTGDFDAYKAALPRKQRKELGRLRRRLEDEGTLEIEFADGSERLDELLDEGFGIEGSGWKTEKGTAIASSPETVSFYGRVAAWAADRGWLRLAFLRLNGRPLAFDLCLEVHGISYVLKGGFDPGYRRFGPGAVLTYESLRRAFGEQTIRSYEFLGGDDDYKLGWTDAVRERDRLQAFSNTARGALGYVAWTVGRRAAKRTLALVRSG